MVRAVPVGVLALGKILLVVVLTALEAEVLRVAGIPANYGYPGCMPASPQTMTAALHREEDWYIAQCLEVDVASQGHTIDEALANLAEAVELYLEEIDDPAGHVTATPLVTSFRLPAA
jgi:predicted RNase H-like HicB family nuclease